MAIVRKKGEIEVHNANCTCWNCPAIDLIGGVDFRAREKSIETHTQNTGGDQKPNIEACSVGLLSGLP